MKSFNNNVEQYICIDAHWAQTIRVILQQIRFLFSSIYCCNICCIMLYRNVQSVTEMKKYVTKSTSYM